MEILGIVSEASITVLCYILGRILKAWDVWDDRKIPAMMCVAGVALGLTAYLIEPAIIPADGILAAMSIGAVSGMTATCVDQMIKQNHAKKEE